MTSVVTDAIVLHAFDYLESSRILRLVTREAGVRSVLARGARRSKRRFGAALDLYAQGTAELQTKPGRDLDTLSAFDVTRARPQLAMQLARFTGASAIAELTLRFARDAADPGLFDAVRAALDDIARGAARSRARRHARRCVARACRAWRRADDRQLRRVSCADRRRRVGDVQPSGGRRALRALRRISREAGARFRRRRAPRCAIG